MRIWNRFRTALLCCLGALGAGLILSWLWNPGPLSFLYFGCSGLLGSILGLFALSPRKFYIAFAAALLAAAGLGLGLLGTISGLLTMAAVCALAFAAAAKCGHGFYGPLGIWSTLLPLAGALLQRSGWGCFCAAIALLLCLDGFRDRSLRQSIHMEKDSHISSFPAGLTSHSFFLYGSFALLAVAAALGLWVLARALSGTVKLLFHWLLTGTGALGYGLALLLKRLMDWILYLLNLIPTPAGHTPDKGSDFKLDLAPYDGGSKISTLILILLVAAGIIGLACVLGIALKRSLGRTRSEKMGQPDYVDEIERLRHPGFHLFRGRGRKQKLSDFSSNAMKIRFLFQQLLKARSHQDSSVFSKTPNELRQSQAPGEQTLIDAYNRVRYGQGDATAEEVASAAQWLRKIQ